jgi:hypothetical protein
MTRTKVPQLAPKTFAAMKTKQLNAVLTKPKMGNSVTIPQLEALTKKQVKNLPAKFTKALDAEQTLALTQDPAAAAAA